MAQEYARDRPMGFNNGIKSVAIVGVSSFQDAGIYLKISELFIRLEVISASISLKLSSKPESTL